MRDWVLSVSQLNEYVRKQLASDPMLKALKLRGEISGLKRHTSGHHYFTLKDDEARIACVMFRQNAMRLNFTPKDGARVVLTGSVSLFSRDGSYQFYCEDMRADGIGELYLRFEELKRKLEAEGLFDPSIKKPLPLLPKAIGVVTSKTGAVFQDIIRVLKRRYPSAKIILRNTKVQGEGAADDIANAIEELNRCKMVDVIICGRGGGSIEDLWSFNDEIVARAIVGSTLPIISAVGHETDFTIADFVADMRAPTPSAAAEIVMPKISDLHMEIDNIDKRIFRAQQSRLDILKTRLDICLKSRVLKSPSAFIELHRDKLKSLMDRAQRASLNNLAAMHSNLDKIHTTLKALSPQGVLERGYVLVSHNGKLVTTGRDLTVNDKIMLNFHDGAISANIDSTLEDKND